MKPISARLSERILPNIRTSFELFAMHWREVDASWSYPSHAHALHEINLVTDGVQQFIVGEASYRMEAGDLLLIPPGAVHEARVAQVPMAYFCLHFDINDHLLLPLLKKVESPFFSRSSELAREIQPALIRLQELSWQDGAGGNVAGRMRIQSAVFELFARLGEALSDMQEQQETPQVRGQALARRLALLIEEEARSLKVRHAADGAVDTNTAAAISRLAAAAGYSVSHCHRVFHSCYGKSPRAYLSELVLQEAYVLLCETSLSIEEIAALLGYKEVAHFSRQFKRWTGTPPSRCRSREAIKR